MNAETLFELGFALIFTGVVVVVVAAFWFVFSRSVKREDAKAGGIIIIGPVPIVFGTDKESVRKVFLLSLALTIVLLVTMLIYYFVFR